MRLAEGSLPSPVASSGEKKNESVGVINGRQRAQLLFSSDSCFMKPGTDRWWNIIQLILTWTCHVEKKIAGFPISEQHKDAWMLVGMSTFFGDYQQSNNPNISPPGTAWIEIPPIDSGAAVAIFSNPCNHSGVSQRERISVNANAASTVAVGWNSSLLPWRPREVFLDLIWQYPWWE